MTGAADTAPCGCGFVAGGAGCRGFAPWPWMSKLLHVGRIESFHPAGEFESVSRLVAAETLENVAAKVDGQARRSWCAFGTFWMPWERTEGRCPISFYLRFDLVMAEYIGKPKLFAKLLEIDPFGHCWLLSLAIGMNGNTLRREQICPQPARDSGSAQASWMLRGVRNARGASSVQSCLRRSAVQRRISLSTAVSDCPVFRSLARLSEACGLGTARGIRPCQ